MANPPLRVAVAGLGFMGATHIRAWYKVPGAQLTAIVSGDPRRLGGDLSEVGGNLESGSTQFDFSEAKRFRILSEALSDPEIDAIDLCLPTHLHAEAGISCLKAGKHVFIEKPLARTSEEAYQLLKQAERSKRVLMAGHVLRFFPEWQELSNLLRKSPMKLASFRRNCARPSWSTWLQDEKLSGGAPLDLLIHDADFVIHCFGIPERVSAVGFVSQNLKTDWLSAHCSFQDGNIATISGGWHPAPDYPFSMQFSAITPERSLEYDSLTAPASSSDPWVSQLQHFADSARLGKPPSLIVPLEGARAVRLVEIMVKSRNRNGEPLPWTD